MSRVNHSTHGAATPGPWEWGSIGMGYSIMGDGKGHTVAFTNTASCSKAALRHNVTKDAEEQANARLIAAAPELLEACEKIFDQISGAIAYDKCARLLENAIKKARGE